MRLRTDLASVPKANLPGISGSASRLGRRSEGPERLKGALGSSQNNTEPDTYRTLQSSYGLYGLERLRWGELPCRKVNWSPRGGAKRHSRQGLSGRNGQMVILARFSVFRARAAEYA